MELPSSCLRRCRNFPLCGYRDRYSRYSQLLSFRPRTRRRFTLPERLQRLLGAIVAIYWLLMLIGRFCSSIISGKVSTRAQLITVSAVGIVLVILAIVTPKTVTFNVPEVIYSGGAVAPVSALFLVLCGLCTSVMWGGIFNLAVEGLGKYTAQASGIFMMMVVGGGVMPLIPNWIA